MPDAARVREQTRLTWSLAGGAMLFLVALEALYLLAYGVCDGAPRWPMHLVALVSAGLSALLAMWAWRHRAHEATTDEGRGPEDAPVNWLARGSAIANAWFMLVILAAEIVIVGQRQCW